MVYPYTFTFSSKYNGYTVDGLDTFQSRASITMLSPIHSRAIILSTLRVLLRITQSSRAFSDHFPTISDVLLTTWPPLRMLPTAKGKEKASGTRLNVLAATLEIVKGIMTSGLDASPICTEKVATKVCEVFTHRLCGEENDFEDRIFDEILRDLFQRIKTLLERKDVPYLGLRQVIAETVVESGDTLVDWFSSPELKSMELRVYLSFFFQYFRPTDCSS